MSTIEIKNAKIGSTSLGWSHNIMDARLHLKYDKSGGQSFGGYALTGWNPELGERIGVAWGMEFIRRILKTVGVDFWEKLPGTPIRVKAEHGKVHEIGHYLEDKWFNPGKDLDFLLEKE